MLKLMKTDLVRVLKDKLFLIVCILGVVFAAITPLLYKGIAMIVPEAEALLGSMSPLSQFFAAFSLGNNFGLIAPIMIILILCKDFNHGTIRNKIIGGYSRLEIFASMFCVFAIVMVVLIVAHALLTLGLSMALFPDAKLEMDGKYFAQSLYFVLLVYLFLAAFLAWMWASMKNTGLVIVTYVGAVFGLTMLSTVFVGVESLLSAKEIYPNLQKALEIFQNCNLFYSSGLIGIGMDMEYTKREVLCYILSPIVCGGGLLTLGFLSFKKRDLK